MRHDHEKLRLQEFNRFDIERILRENIETLNLENQRMLARSEEYGESLGSNTQRFMLNEIENNTAQALRILSILFYSNDIDTVFASGPLVRKEGSQ